MNLFIVSIFERTGKGEMSLLLGTIFERRQGKENLTYSTIQYMSVCLLMGSLRGDREKKN